MSSDSDEMKLNEAARAEYLARWEAVETAKAQELAAKTEERAWEIIRSLRPFADIPPDPSNGLGLVEQQAIFHGRKTSTRSDSGLNQPSPDMRPLRLDV